MIDHIWTVVCSHVVTDKETNNVSLHNVVEQLTVEKIPQEIKEKAEKEGVDRFVIPYRISVITLWSRSDLGKGSIGYGQFTLMSPSGESLNEPKNFEINLVDNRRFRSKGNYPGIPVKEAGKYIFRVELRDTENSEWEIVAETPVEVQFKDTSQKK
jgi:hypothetical protein